MSNNIIRVNFFFFISRDNFLKNSRYMIALLPLSLSVFSQKGSSQLIAQSTVFIDSRSEASASRAVYSRELPPRAFPSSRKGSFSVP